VNSTIRLGVRLEAVALTVGEFSETIRKRRQVLFVILSTAKDLNGITIWLVAT